MYRIEFRPRAIRDLRKLAKGARGRIAARIEALSQKPLPRDARKLTGEHNRYRIRIGDYRVIYQVHAEQLLVLVIRIGHRRDVYPALQ